MSKFSPRRNIDLIITGSSRPQLFPFCWESFKKYVHFRGNMRVIFHEDFVFPDDSQKVLQYLNKLKNKGEIHEIITHRPAIGLGMTLDCLIKQHIKSDFVFYLQDDWEFERPIDLDQLLWVMETHPKINLIFFNKSANFGSVSKAPCPQYTFGGVDFILWHGWAFLPGIWRMSKVKEKWIPRDHHPEGKMTNQFGNHETRMSVKYCEENVGAYGLGKTGERAYIRHIGNDWRMARWRLENGKPGGRHDEDTMDYQYRGKWLPEIKQRPHPNNSYTQEQIYKMLKKEAE